MGKDIETLSHFGNERQAANQHRFSNCVTTYLQGKLTGESRLDAEAVARRRCTMLIRKRKRERKQT